MEWLFNGDVLAALVTLTVLEIVLGIDNIVFLSILVGKLPLEQRARARTIGLALALVMRVILLLSISWVIGLTAPLFSLAGQDLSGRDLILIFGGLFLLGKATFEIHSKLEGAEHHGATPAAASFAGIIVQIVLIDAVFSLDSVITAVGMAEDVRVMIAAVVIAIGVMLVSAGPIADFVDRHPTVKMLALSFLLLIGMALVAEGWDQHIPKGYIYFAMAFAVVVELLNLKLRSVSPVRLHEPHLSEVEAEAMAAPPRQA